MTTVMPPFANASLKNNTIAHCFGLDRHTFCIFGYPFEGGYATIIICVIRTCLHKEFLFLKSASSEKKTDFLLEILMISSTRGFLLG